MMKIDRLIIDQATRALNNGRYKNKNYYDDQGMAIGVIEYFIEKIESYLNECLNVENGRCDLTYRHEDCRILMKILYDITKDEKYTDKYWGSIDLEK
jgi:hypothetical protein